MATEVVANAQVFTNTVVAMSGSLAAITVPAKCNFILISNPDGAITEYISFDNSTLFTIKPGQSLSLDCAKFNARNLLYAKAASGTPNMEFVFGAEV